MFDIDSFVTELKPVAKALANCSTILSIEPDDLIDVYHLKSFDEIIDLMKEATYSKIYNLNSEDNYIMMFDKISVNIEFKYEDELFTDSIYFINSKELRNFNFNEYTTSELSKIFSSEFGRKYSKNQGIIYLGNSLMYAIIFPLALAFILWLGLKKRGSLKRLKEYYSIISIISITPAILSFISGWFIGSNSGMVYLASLTILSLFMIYSIIGIPD